MRFPPVIFRRSIPIVMCMTATISYAAPPGPVEPPHPTGFPVSTTPKCGTIDAPLRLTTRIFTPVDAQGYCDTVIERIEPDGSTIITATIDDHSCQSATLVCAADGSGTALLNPGGEWIARRIDAAGNLVGAPRTLATDPRCSSHSTHWMSTSAGDLIALERCAEEHDNYLPRIALRRIPPSGEEPNLFWVATSLDYSTGGVGGAIDDSGNILVVWNTDFGIWAQALSSAGDLLGENFRLDTFPSVRVWRAGVSVQNEGVFVVYWYSQSESGYIARAISIDPDVFVATTTTTTTLPPSPDAPVFGPTRTLPSPPANDPYYPLHDTALFSLKGDGHGSALLRRRRKEGYYLDQVGRSSLFASTDAGHRWAPTAEVAALAPDGDRPLWDGMSPAGTAVSIELVTVREEYEVQRAYRYAVRRSEDLGKTWSLPVTLDSVTFTGGDRNFITDVAISADAGGNWIAATFVRLTDYGSPPDYTGYGERLRVSVSFSSDDGRTWTDSEQIWSESRDGIHLNEDIGSRRPIVASAGSDGSWTIAWRNEIDGALRVARASHAGAPWDIQEITPAHAEDWTRRFFSWLAYGGPALVTLPDGTQVVAWEEEFPPADLGLDSEVYFIRSDDDGQTWSEPAPLGRYAAIDGGNDSAPALAAGADGRILAVWSSHDPLGGIIGTEAHIVSSISVDGGASWSPPAPIDSNAASDSHQDLAPSVVGDEFGRWTVAWTSIALSHYWWPHWTEADVRVAVADVACGNGALDPGEECDDGNPADGDACNSNCRIAYCGNEIVENGEECDSADHSCLAGCELPECGDDVIDAWTELCDDGNDDDSDDCPGSCLPAFCGDGYIQAGNEQCDDGNHDSGDDCVGCKTAFCGDGALRQGFEICDDGDRWSGNSCTELCEPAFCGDGRVEIDVEDCDDPGGSRYGGACTPDCKRSEPCGDIDANNAITTTDALTILRAAVGLEGNCAPDRCDLDGSGHVATNDALMALRAAVGLNIVRRCPPRLTATLILADPRKFSVLQLSVDASGIGVDFNVGAGPGDCQMLISGGLYATNTIDSTLKVAVIASDDLDGPVEIVRCRVYLRHDVAGDGVAEVTVEEAMLADESELSSMPLVVLRLD